MSALLTALTEAGTREDLLAQIARLTEDRARTAALHSARVTELLEANNREVEKRRIAERALKATSFQARVGHWMQACFGPAISADKLERGDRLLEEVLELLQSGGYPPERVAALTGYVWSRPSGEPPQEAGGVEVTLAAYCLAHGLDKHEAGEIELARIWTKVEAIRAKQAAKPTGSALPMEWPQTTTAQMSVAESAAHKLASAVLNYYDCDDDAARRARFDEVIDLAKAISNSSEVALAHTPAPQPGGVKVKARPIDLATMLKHAWIAGWSGTAWEDYDPTEMIVYQILAASCVIPFPAQPGSVDTRPANCRHRLEQEGKPHPKSGCQVAGCRGVFGAVCWTSGASPSPSTSGAEALRPTHRHVKRGSAYRVVGEAEAQVSTGAHIHVYEEPGSQAVINDWWERKVKDGDRLTVYQGTDGKLWVRFTDEFNDGRFDAIEAEA